jgi:hypothetical protein
MAQKANHVAQGLFWFWRLELAVSGHLLKKFRENGPAGVADDLGNAAATNRVDHSGHLDHIAGDPDRLIRDFAIVFFGHCRHPGHGAFPFYEKDLRWDSQALS